MIVLDTKDNGKAIISLVTSFTDSINSEELFRQIVFRLEENKLKKYPKILNLVTMSAILNKESEDGEILLIPSHYIWNCFIEESLVLEGEKKKLILTKPAIAAYINEGVKVILRAGEIEVEVGNEKLEEIMRILANDIGREILSFVKRYRKAALILTHDGMILQASTAERKIKDGISDILIPFYVRR